MKKLLFIFNPHTGGGRLKAKLMPILNLYATAGYNIAVHPTLAKGDACSAAKEKGPWADLVVCCGGDGTLNEVVHGLMQLKKRPLLGYIPGGTTNDFASSLNLPKTDMLLAAKRTITPKKLFSCDIGLFNEDYFSYVAAFGAFTDVSYETPQAKKNVFGHFAYVLEGISRLPTIQAHRLRLEYENTVIEGDFIYGMVSNSTSVGGFSFPGLREVHMDDGCFEMLLVRKPARLSELGALSAAVLAQNIENSPLLVLARVKKLSIHSSEDMPWTLDGEFGGRLTNVEISVKMQALQVCI